MQPAQTVQPGYSVPFAIPPHPTHDTLTPGDLLKPSTKLDRATALPTRALGAVASVLLIAGALSIALAVWLSLRVTHEIDAESGQLYAAEELLSDMKDLETGERGYVITGEPRYLEPYQHAVSVLDNDLARVERSGGVNGASLKAPVQAKRQFAAFVVATRRDEGREAARAHILSGEDKRYMDQVRTAVQALREESEQKIQMQTRMRDVRTPILESIGSVALLLAFGTLLLLNRRRRSSEQASNELLSQVLEHAPIGMGLIDGQAHLLHLNPTLARMSDHDPKTELGRNVFEVFPRLQEQLAEPLYQVIKERVVRTNLQVSTPTAESGTVHTYQVGFFPLPAASSSEAGGAGIVVTDITEEKLAEQRVQESEERFRALVENSASIIWTTSPDGQLKGEQPTWTRFTGQSREDYAGFGWLDVLHPDDRQCILAEWQKAVEGRKNFDVEYRLRRADGEWRDMSVCGLPVLTSEGAIREWVGTNTDITDRKQAQADLEAAKVAAETANRAKSQFLANMSHELRTPLSAVIGYSELLEEEMEDAEDQANLQDVRKIQSNARHLLSLINDVLDLSKIEADRMSVYAEDFTVDSLLDSVRTTMSGLVEQKGNRLVIEAGPDLGLMHNDLVKLRQCLFNLIGNAAKFTEAGSVTLRVARYGADLTFDVVDSGIGMTEDQLSRLFERFSQADDSTTRRFGGTGLGLAITRAFCRLMGGEIKVSSIYGQGSTFSMRIPAVLPSNAVEEEPVKAEDEQAGKQVVLVIDDDEAQRDLLSRFLEREGFSVRTAADGKSGIELARMLRPRAILLDVMMPQMDGWAVLTAIKNDPTIEHTPVVMVSFVNEPGLSEYLGAAETVLKPVDWNKLKDVMERFRGEAGELLIVEDDPDTRLRLRTIFEKDGWTVSEAENGLAALDALMHAPPQVILLDLTMPVMDGFTFLSEVRSRPGTKDIPVVVYTARLLNEEERKRLEAADRVLVKGETDLRQLSGTLRALSPQLATGPSTEVAEIGHLSHPKT